MHYSLYSKGGLFMKLQPAQIFGEYQKGVQYKSSMGKRGMYEQNRINERFFIGDQWHGAKCGSDRPLVRHNVIKRIGDYKMSQILSDPVSVVFSADGISDSLSTTFDCEKASGIYQSGSAPTTDEINLVTAAFGRYYDVTAERVKMNALNEKLLRNAYIGGTSVLYTYWDPSVATGLYADESKRVKLKGDINCEVLDIEDVFFGDPYIEDVQNQPYIIISSIRETEDVLREARLNGADITALRNIEESAYDGKVTVLTRLYKEYKADGSYTIKSVKVTEKAFVRKEFDTELRLYPLAVFRWERKNNCIYGESEITYLIPNQIAINRMITAKVWSAMTTGMPIMLVNGDTVTEKITNEPGQIIKVFGSNEDVAGAVKYVTPPSFAENFDASIESLINNTLTHSGANEVALGDSRADNATALMEMRSAALMPLNIIKNRYYAFVEEVSRIWADFWVTYYGMRKIKLKDQNKIRYMPFDGQRYRDLIINTKVEVGAGTAYSEQETVSALLTLYEKDAINRKQLIERLPAGIVPDKNGLLNDNVQEEQNEGL